MILAATTQSLEIKLGGAITTNQLPVSVEFNDVTTTTFTPGHQDSQTNNTTVVTILSAPASSTYRVVRHINVYNKDTVSATVTIQFNNNSTVRELTVRTLLSGQTLTWSAEAGWQIMYVQTATDDIAGIIRIATQAEMETATDTTVAVVPGRLQFHPAACKCWGKAVGAGTGLTVSYNTTSITDTGTGRLGVTIATDFSSANYSVLCTLERSSTALTASIVEDNNIRNASPAAGSFEIESYDHTATTMVAQDPANYFWECFGDQA